MRENIVNAAPAPAGGHRVTDEDSSEPLLGASPYGPKLPIVHAIASDPVKALPFALGWRVFLGMGQVDPLKTPKVL